MLNVIEFNADGQDVRQLKKATLDNGLIVSLKIVIAFSCFYNLKLNIKETGKATKD